MNESLKEFAKQYGPFAFGIFSLLVIWVVIITPVLDRNTLDFKQQQELIKLLNTSINSLNNVAVEQNRLSETLKESAVLLEDAVKRHNESSHRNVESTAP